MKASQSRLVLDTSVIIDLQRGGIVKELFALSYEFVSPDVIIAELGEPDGTDLENLGLKSAEFTSEQVREVLELTPHHPHISARDIFALLLASHGGLPLLTGDRSLRNLAGKHRVPVHGTLWILDEMVKQSVLTKGQAVHALRQILLQGGRLPAEECEKRLRTWEEK